MLIPRGGASLIQTVVAESTVPVIETGTGNCHVYVDAHADLDMAERILLNAKCQRPGVCNAAESLLVHRDVAADFLPRAAKALKQRGVEIRGCAETLAFIPEATPAKEEDHEAEYLDLIISVKVVRDIEEAMEHIATYGSRHTEAIVTSDYGRALRFLREVDASAVLVNASTRLNDGYQFGGVARVRDDATLARIRSLAIPPAWTDVWISPSPRAKLQATGVDAAGRRQYRYHADFRAAQEEAKFQRLVQFAERLPDLRLAMGEHMTLEPTHPDRLCAVAVRLINLAWFRVGSPRYAQHSRTYGVTTLCKRHVTVRGTRVKFVFRAKHRQLVRTTLVDHELADARVAAVVVVTEPQIDVLG